MQITELGNIPLARRLITILAINALFFILTITAAGGGLNPPAAIMAGLVLLIVAIGAALRGVGDVRDMTEERDEAKKQCLDMGVNMSEIFEVVQNIDKGDLGARMPATFSDELLRKFAALMNATLDRLQANVDSDSESRSYIHSRVENLLAVAKQVQSGDLAARAEVVNPDDEIGRLAIGINEMIQNLEQMNNDMDGYNMDVALSLSENFEALTQVSKGCLSGSVTVASSNELLNKLSQVVNNTIQKLRELIGKTDSAVTHVRQFSEELSKSISHVSEGANQIASSVQDMAKGADEQCRGVEETSKVFDSLLQTINQIAKGAQQQAIGVEQTSRIVNEMSVVLEASVRSLQEIVSIFRDSGTRALAGQDAIAKAIDNITQVHRTVEEAAQMVDRLGGSSKRISEITEMIDDIAEQTNLLALNAAIEAGRAGEHGKGFAVVAAEVRKLAERSVKATKQISQLVSGVQEETNQAVTSIRAGARQVEQGVSLGEQAKSALTDIMGSISRTNEEINRISSVIEDMSGRNQKIVEAMDSVASIVEENTAATEEMAACSRQVEEATRRVLIVSQDNAAAAEEISASTEEQTASVMEISSSINSLNVLVKDLEDVVRNFTL